MDRIAEVELGETARFVEKPTEEKSSTPLRAALGAAATRIALPFYSDKPNSYVTGRGSKFHPVYQVYMESLRWWGALVLATYFAPRTSTPEAAQADLIAAGLVIAVPSLFHAIQESRGPVGRVVIAGSGWLGHRMVDAGIATRRVGATLGREIQGSK